MKDIDTTTESLGAAAEPADADSLTRKFQRELNAGLISLVLLGILDRATEDLYGYQIAKQLQQDDPEGSPIKQGALYPVLRTLAAQGLLASRIVPSYSGPPRRYYRITPEGRQTYARWLTAWRDTRNFVERLTGADTGVTG